jgi:hypothetical protein
VAVPIDSSKASSLDERGPAFLDLLRAFVLFENLDAFLAFED